MEYEDINEYNLAMKHYKLAFKAGNKSSLLFNQIAWLELEFLNGDPQIAHDFALKTIKKSRNNPDFLDTYGWALFHLNKYKEALAFFHKAHTLKPDISCINYHLGITYYALDNLDNAKFYLHKQFQLTPQNRYGIMANEALKKIM